MALFVKSHFPGRMFIMPWSIKASIAAFGTFCSLITGFSAVLVRRSTYASWRDRCFRVEGRPSTSFQSHERLLVLLLHFFIVLGRLSLGCGRR